MKKILLYTFMLLVGIAFTGCSDKETNGVADREFMTMFRLQDNTNKNDQDMMPYYCHVEGNTQYLYWYKVDDCYGYEIKWFYANTVQGGSAEVWEKAEADGYMKGHVIIDNPNQIELVIPNLEYSKGYRYAIRVLNSSDLNDPKNSAWYGYGTQQNWQDYYASTTAERYACPNVVPYVELFDDTKPNYKTSFKVYINKSVTTDKEWDDVTATLVDVPYDADKIAGFKEHFTSPDGQNWKVDYFTIVPSDETVKANVPFNNEGKYVPTAQDWQRGWFLVEGLSPNTLYTVAAWDADIPVKVDASYLNAMERTPGDAPADRYLGHVPAQVDTINGKVYDIAKWNAMKIDTIITNYMKNNVEGEGKRFFLDGGKAYFISSSVEMIKGFTLETRPEDLAQGKRATVYLGGIAYDGHSTNFITGNSAENYADPTVQLKMNGITFRGIDFDCPMAQKVVGAATGSGNYFINMLSKNIGFRLAKLEFDDCSFQNFIRGWYRVQGNYNFNIGQFIINNCEFYNMGPYQAGKPGYNFVHFELKNRGKSNLLNNFVCTNNVFYNNAHGALLSDKNTDVTWDKTVRWNVTIKNNTFVNFGNDSKDAYIVGYLGKIPGGSHFTVTDNLIILTKDPADKRTMHCDGWRIADIKGGDGSGSVVFEVGNNWSTNDNLKNGQVLNQYPFSGSSSIAKWYNESTEETWFPMGKAELVVHADNISATELMKSPNPPHLMDPDNRQKTDYECDNIDGLYYNLSQKTLESEIYKRNIGAPRLRQGK